MANNGPSTATCVDITTCKTTTTSLYRKYVAAILAARESDPLHYCCVLYLCVCVSTEVHCKTDSSLGTYTRSLETPHPHNTHAFPWEPHRMMTAERLVGGGGSGGRVQYTVWNTIPPITIISRTNCTIFLLLDCVNNISKISPFFFSERHSLVFYSF